jgi:hypothetical protein
MGGAPGLTPPAAGTGVPVPSGASAGGESRGPQSKQHEENAPSPDELLPWLVGRWVAPRKICWPIAWSEPIELQPSRRHRCEAADVRFELELVFAASPGKVGGVLMAVGEDGRRHDVVDFVIARDNAGYSLAWHEGGVRYVFSGQLQQDASIGSELARFYLVRNPSSRDPYPIVIDFHLMTGQLSFRRAHGPQVGAAVERTYTFERATTSRP